MTHSLPVATSEQALDLLMGLERLDIRLAADGDQLAFDAPEGVFTSELKARVAPLKAEILTLLAERATDTSSVGVFPASVGQEGMWVARQEEADPANYLIQYRIPIKAEWPVEAVQAALDLMSARHEAIRTCFVERDGRLWQRILPPHAVDLPQVTLRAEDVQAHVSQIMSDQMDSPASLYTGPLFRPVLAVSDGGYRSLILTIDHIVFDGMSADVFKRDFESAVAALAAGDYPALPELTTTARQVALRENDWTDGSEGEAARSFWEDRIQSLEPGGLPTAVARDPRRALQGRRRRHTLSDQAVDGLFRITKEVAKTETVAWLSIVGACLMRHKEDGRGVSLGLPFNGRGTRDMAGLVGHFANVLPVVVPGDGDLSFANFTKQIRRDMMSMMPHQWYPLIRIAEAMARRDGEATFPLDAVTFVQKRVQTSGDGAVVAGGYHGGAGKFELTIGLDLGPGKAGTVLIEHDELLYPAEMIELFIDRLETLLINAAADVSVPVGRVKLLSDTEWDQVVNGFNQTALDYPSDCAITDVISKTAQRVPDLVAMTQAERSLTYGEVERITDAIAAGLQTDGVGHGDVVAVSMHRSADAIMVLMGILKAGAAFLPLDRTLPISVIRTLFERSGCKFLVVDDVDDNRLGPVAELVHMMAAETLWQSKATRRPVKIGGGDRAYVMFTSGSTGEPKGVEIPHRGISRLVHGEAVGPMREGDVFGQTAPIGFDASTLEIWWPLINGATLCFIDQEELFDPNALRNRIVQDRVTHLWFAASLMNRVAEDHPDVFRGLKTLITGGETVSPAHVLRIFEACPGVAIFNGYGPTENSVAVSFHRITEEDARSTSIPIGPPIPATRAYILDANKEPLPIGVWGDLYAAGDGVAIGYSGRPELTDAAFSYLPWRPQERIYKTGDLVRWRADGVMEFAGRRDGMVKVRGRRIEIEAVEAVLTTYDGVRDVGVVAVGTGFDRVLVALVAAETVEEAGWRRHINNSLPDFMVPEYFLSVDELPVTKNGKKDRKLLIKQAEAGITSRDAAAGRPPEGALEVMIAAKFAEVFAGTPIDADSDFFALGGHSLVAVRLAGLIEAEIGTRPSIRSLMAGRTVAGMAREIAALIGEEQTTEDETNAPAVIAHGDSFPLSANQARLWMVQRMNPETGAYNVPFCIEMDGVIDEQRFSDAVVEMAERQHAMRYRVVVDPSIGLEARQTLGSAEECRPLFLDFRGDADPEGVAGDRINAEAVRAFELEAEAPVRSFLMKVSDTSYRFLIVYHHIAFDGWSIPILFRELITLYLGNTDLPEITYHYEDFAAWQRDYIASDACEAAIQRWIDRLTPLPEPLEMPTDRKRPAVRVFDGASNIYEFDQDLGESMEKFARKCGATTFMVAQAVLDILFYRHTGQTDFAMGTLVAGRDRTDVENLIGFFVNTLVLRHTIDPSWNFMRLLDHVREASLAAMDDQDAPFDSIVQALDVPRDTSRNPIFDVLTVWQQTNQEDFELPEFSISRSKDLDFDTSKFDLSFHFSKQPDGLEVGVEYDTALFDESTIDDFMDRYFLIARQVMEAPELSIERLHVLTDQDKETLAGFNDTKTDMDTDRTIPAPFLDQVAENDGRRAVISDTGTLDYDAFAKKAAAIAERLRGDGVQPGDIVAVMGPRSADLLAGIHGILLAGAAYAPLDPDQPRARLFGMLDDLDAAAILAPDALQELLAPRSERVVSLVTAADAAFDGTPQDFGDDPEAEAYVIFTSGSTGRPKGVAVAHHSALNRILWMQKEFPIGPDDVVLQKTSVTFDVSVWELFWWSWTGATVSLPPVGAERDPLALIDWIDKTGVTIMHMVPSQLGIFLTCLEDGRGDISKLSKLRKVFASGEALDSSLVERFSRTLFARQGTELHNLYGPTEATVDVTWQACSPWAGGEDVPIGAPVANTQIHILDPKGRPVPPGVNGEIHIGGPQVAQRYVNREDLTQDRFIPDPFSGTGALYKTGDLGSWRKDGVVLYRGRIDHQIKVRGFRVEAGEVEHALETHAAVDRALVKLQRADDGLAELYAYLLLKDDITASELRAHLRDRLPEHMVPAAYFRMDKLPMTTSGKVDRKALKGERLDNKPTAAASVTPKPKPAMAVPVMTKAAAPTSPTKSLAGLTSDVAAIWREVMPHRDFGVNDRFFDAGGNSLLLIRLHERLNAAWPDVFSITDLFTLATVSEQAQKIADARPDLVAAEEPASTPQPSRLAQPRSLTTKSAPVAGDRRPASEFPQTDGAMAIIGMAVRLADFDDLDSFWQNIIGGVDRVRAFPESRMEVAQSLAGVMGTELADSLREVAYLDDSVAFDPSRFRLSPMDAALMDPEQRLFLLTAGRALENAGYGGKALHGRKIGTYVGAAPTTLFKDAATRALPEKTEQIMALNVPSNVATRLSYLNDWKGPACVVDTACSSTLSALHQARRALMAGDCEMALVGGAKLISIPPSSEPALTIDSSNARTRAFSEGADGTGMGEGAVAFLLRPLEHALADGDAIHGVVIGSAIAQDGASSGPAAPNPAAQGELIRTTAQDAGIELKTISYFEAHGTGTALGDPIEIDGLTRAFNGTEHGTAKIGSVKGNFGHLDSAAGALGMAKAILTLQHRVAAPQPFFETPNPRIDFDKAPVSVMTQPTPLEGNGTPLRAGVSSFGLSGIIAHAMLEEAPMRDVAELTDGLSVISLSAGDRNTLESYAKQLLATLQSSADWTVEGVARTLATGRPSLGYRYALVADAETLIPNLSDAIANGIGLAAIGQIKPNGLTVPALWADPMGAEAARVAFMGGADLVWPEEVAAPRVHLPAVPYVLKRCFPDLSTYKPAVVERKVIEAPKPDFVGEPVRTRDGIRHAVHLDRPDFWPVAEHLLLGKPTLVGMGMVPIMSAALGESFAVDRLRWMRPLQTDGLEAGSVALAIEEDGKIVLEGRSLDGRWTSFVDARKAAPVPLTPVSVDTLLARCPVVQPRETFVGDEGTVSVTARWDVKREVRTSTDGSEIIARLAVPVGSENDLLTALHPGLLDAAASLCIDRPGAVPAECGEIRVARALTSEVLVHVVRVESTATRLVADVRLYDARSGAALLSMTGLRFGIVGQAAVAQQAPAPAVSSAPKPVALCRRTWTEEPRPTGARPAEVTVIGSGLLADRLSALLDRQGRLTKQLSDEGLDASALSSAQDFVLALETSLDVAERTADVLQKIMTASKGQRRVLAVGSGAIAVGGVAVDPNAALLMGVMIAAGYEEPTARMGYVDLEPGQALDLVLDEFAAMTPSFPHRIFLRNGRRLSMAAAPVELTEADAAKLEAPVWPDSGVCVVTGGLGGYALTLAERFANDKKVALALLSRRSQPDAWQSEKVAELRRAGIRVELFSCDIANADALSAALSRIRTEMGPITAIAHTAGMPDGGFLVNRDLASFAPVLSPKVQGTINLDRLTREDPVQAFVMFGSSTSDTGALGQTAYTAANAYLDAFVSWRRAQGYPASTVGWTALTDVGMAARLNTPLAEGIYLSPASAGAIWPQVLTAAALIEDGRVATYDASILIQLLSATQQITAVDTAPKVAEPVSQTLTGPALMKAVTTIWAEVLGYDEVSVEEDFYSLGGDSISGMQIVTRINEELGQTISLSDLFDTETIAALVEMMGSATATMELGAAVAEAPSAVVVPLETGRVAEVESMPAPAVVVPEVKVEPVQSLAPAATAPEPGPRFPVGWEQLAVLRAETTTSPGTAYCLPQLISMPAGTTVAKMEQVAEQLVARHEILRAKLHQAGEDWEMEILPPYPVKLTLIDLPEGADLMAEYEKALVPFDLTAAPLVRFAAYREATGKMHFAYDVHHIMADGFTIELLAGDIAALTMGIENPTSKRTFTEYAELSRQGEAANREEAKAYWLGQYEDGIPRLDLPSDNRRPEIHTWRGGAAAFAFSADQVKKLRKFARSRRTTPYTVVLASWVATLHRWTGQDDIVIAVPVDVREQYGFSDTLGMMVSLLPLRFNVSSANTGVELVGQAHATNNACMRYRSFGLGQLLETLAPPVSTDRTLLGEVTLSYMNFRAAIPTDQGSDFSMAGASRAECKNDISIFVRDAGEAISVSMEYYADLFSEEQIARLSQSYLALLDELMDMPELPLGAMRMVPEAGARELSGLENGPVPAPLPEMSIVEGFKAARDKRADKVAVDEGAAKWTYTDLHKRACRVAAGLKSEKIGAGDRVGVHMARGGALVSTLLGILATGASYVPLDPANPTERNAVILDDTACQIVLADAAGEKALSSIEGSFRIVSSDDLVDAMTKKRTKLTLPEADGGEAVACVLYTSGSTGKPKGALIPHRAVIRLAFGQGAYRCEESDRVFHASSIGFDVSMLEIWGTLLNHGTCCVANREQVLDPKTLRDTIKGYGITRMWMTCSLFNRQVDSFPDTFAEVGVVMTGGEVLSARHIRTALAHCPKTRFFNGYGPTENTVFSTNHLLSRADLDLRSIPVGRPIAYDTVKVLDGQAQPVPAGVEGEICVGGPGLALGYLNLPELTAERFIEDPARPGERLYRTGDVGRWRDDGALEYIGRLDGQVKLRGNRIELDEVSNAMEDEPGILMAAALIDPEEELLIGCVVSDGSQLDGEALRRTVASRLPSYMVPSRFVRFDSFPLNTNGKLDRKKLLATLDQAQSLSTQVEQLTPLLTEAQKIVAETFAAVFERPIVSRTAHFLDLGGHSLLAIRIVNAIAERTGIRISFGDFFRDPSVEAVAKLLNMDEGQSGGIPRAEPAEFYPASHAQRRLYLLSGMENGSGALNIPMVTQLGRNVDLDRLRTAFTALIRRHDALRTVIEERDGDIVQRISDQEEPQITIHDLRGRQDVEAEVLRLSRLEMATPIPLDEPPLLRCRVYQVDDETTLLMINIHHIAADGWSVTILLKELGALYEAGGTDVDRMTAAAGLAPLPIAYRDYAAWLQNHDWSEASNFWKERLAGAPQQISLPTDRPVPAQQSFRGASFKRMMDEGLAEALSGLAARHNTTLATVGLAIYSALLYRLTRQSDLVIGMGVAGRDRSEVEGLIGFFVNILPIRLQIDEDTDFSDLIAQVRERMLEALDYRDYPFDQLIRELGVSRRSTRQPLVNAVFEYQRFFGREDAGLPEVSRSQADQESVPQKDFDDLVEMSTAKHDLMLFIREEPFGTALVVEYDTDLFDAATVERWFEYLLLIAKAACDAEHKDAAQ